MESQKKNYESPHSKVWIVEVQGLVCQSPTETPEDDPTEIPW